MPPRFSPQFLVKLEMTESKLERLWHGTQPLLNLKELDLSLSRNLTAFPDLSNATNLEKLILRECESLVMIHSSSLQNLHKLRELDMSLCRSLEVLPTDINLESLTKLNLNGCSRWRTFPDISRNIKDLLLKSTAIEEVPSSVQNITRLNTLMMGDCKELRKISPSISKLKLLQILEFSGCKNVECFPTAIFYANHLTRNLRLLLDNTEEASLPTFQPTCNMPTFGGGLVLSNNVFESIPSFVGHIYQLRSLLLFRCKNLKSLPNLPPSLEYLYTDGCESLSRISSSFKNPQSILSFVDCSSLDEEAEKLIIQETICKYRFLPDKEVPPYFTHRVTGSSITIPLDTSPTSALLRCKVCLVLAGEPNPDNWTWKKSHITCRFRGKRDGIVRLYGLRDMSNHVLESDHLCVLDLFFLLDEDKDTKAVCEEVFFGFKCSSHVIIQCGIEILEFYSSLDDSLYYPKAWTFEDEEDDGNNDSDGSYEFGDKEESGDNYGDSDCETEIDGSRGVEPIDEEDGKRCNVEDDIESSAKRRKANLDEDKCISC
ncbi:unnamed protein product [Microthlaspi erraticum]|uniref:Ig-like domain-containing protein n=1 Tax=Microthlaspi erraticum TaxID=1685480 RepID=A0A6D2HRV7_9BRAS|nr:unnamed protein product [Microthlaspi erraticum]